VLLLTVWEMLTTTQLHFTTHIHFVFIDKDACKMLCYKQPDYLSQINHRSRVLFIRGSWMLFLK